jgi:hypothetical protein
MTTSGEPGYGAWTSFHPCNRPQFANKSDDFEASGSCSRTRIVQCGENRLGPPISYSVVQAQIFAAKIASDSVLTTTYSHTVSTLHLSNNYSPTSGELEYCVSTSFHPCTRPQFLNETVDFETLASGSPTEIVSCGRTTPIFQHCDTCGAKSLCGDYASIVVPVWLVIKVPHMGRYTFPCDCS